MSIRYWESEQPMVVVTGKNVLRFFKQAGKLQVSQPNWTDKNGEEKQGKTVTLDLTALRESDEGLELLRQMLG